MLYASTLPWLISICSAAPFNPETESPDDSHFDHIYHSGFLIVFCMAAMTLILL